MAFTVVIWWMLFYAKWRIWLILFCFIVDMGKDKKAWFFSLKSFMFCVLEILENPGEKKEMNTWWFLPPLLSN